jgi:molecular chaperone DnaK (HSP70)
VETGIQRQRGSGCLNESRYIIGIDLGTTNSTLSFIDTAGGDDLPIKAFSIPQLAEQGIVKDLRTLPSFLYIPGEYELPAGAAALPWDRNQSYIIGEFARIQGARVPSNLVSSAKSWLCHNRVDRKGPILPWGVKTSVRRISPVEASSRYLRHMKDAWNYVMAEGPRERLFENQQIIITIPASFDESARELTAEAAREAGIHSFTMLEEPQAAFYAWISSHEQTWRESAGRDKLVLVVDVGGGTTDFTLIASGNREGRPSFERVAVGDHLMLGGDNMDLALAREIEKMIMGGSGKFDFQQWLSAVCQCRAAKEEILEGTGKESVTVTILGAGKSVIGGARKAGLSAEMVRERIINGFFNEAEIGEEVQKSRTSGLQELGLPFVYDTSIMRHVASFLKRHAADKGLPQMKDPESGLDIVRPDAVLFNGGVFRSLFIRRQVTRIIRDWFEDGAWSLDILENEEFDQAVSIGAAYYGLVITGKGERISGGSAKAYYISVERAAGKTDTGMQNPVTLVCLVPRGTVEGEEIHLPDTEFQVMTNRPVSFSLYSSSYRAGDKKGDIITAERDEFVELPPIKTVLHYGKKSGSLRIPVSLGVRLNEFGTLDVWCESKKTTHRWKLAFQLRAEEQRPASIKEGGMEHTVDESAVDESMCLIEQAFLSSPGTPSEVTPENVIKKTEALLGLDRKVWPLFAIRKMWDFLIKMKDRRKATNLHESRWFNLSGFLLRPGFGYGLDDWRMKELWKVYLEGLAHPNNGQCRSAWLIHWRRVAGGLDSSKQEVIFGQIAPWLLPSRKKKKKTTRLSGAEMSEMWMLAASLENLPVSVKVELGDELMKNIMNMQGKSLDQYYWALSRIGARAPFHGDADRVVPAETVERWISRLLDAEWPGPEKAGYAITQMARKTGDRLRDIDEEHAEKIIRRLSQYKWAERLITQLREAVPLEQQDEKNIYGESLPAGLYIEH